MATFLFLVQMNAVALRFNYVCSGFETDKLVASMVICNLNLAHTPAPQAPPLYTCLHSGRRQVMV